jgi:hypothetical protein
MKISPETVFRYKPYDAFGKKLVLNQELYFCTYEQLNDPFEGAICCTRHELMTEIELKKWLSEAHEFEYPALKLSERSKLIDALYEELIKDDKKELISRSRKMHEATRSDSGIISLSCLENNQMMWSHYANGHRGFCIGFHTDLLKGVGAIMGKVDYTDSFPTIQNLPRNSDGYLRTFVTEAFTKHSDWAGEEEFRIFLEPCVNRVVKFPIEAVASVSFGCKMPVLEREELAIKCRALYPHAKLFQAVHKEHSFSIQLESIDN